MGGKLWQFDAWVHNAGYRKLIESAQEVPTLRNGAFDAWFDSLSARTVKTLYKNESIRDAIEDRLRGSGGLHEYLMVAAAPSWKKWGVSMTQFRSMTSSIADLNNGLAKGWVHSTGGLTEAFNSKRVHNQLQKIIERSGSLNEFKQNLAPWANQWLNGGIKALPEALRG